jgi:Zn-dependent protease with chaperone function
MDGGTMVGFALAFVTATWSLSVVLCAAGALAVRLSTRDPAVERTAAAIAVASPPLLGLAAVVAIVVHSVAAAGGPGDHCAPHDHHLHLCVVHGTAWGREAWAVVAATVMGTFMLARVIGLGAAHVRGARAARDLRRVSVVSDGVHLVSAERPFLFVTGLARGAIFVSSAAWQALDAGERAAAIAHERAHIRHRDVLARAALTLCAIAGVPLLAGRMLRRWDSATERLRDRDASAATGDPTAVASALVVLARQGARAPAWSLSFAPSGELPLRVATVLADRPFHRRAAARLAQAACVAAATAAVLAFAGADPLHHLLETILGVF